jgi:hypothetical protein
MKLARMKRQLQVTPGAARCPDNSAWNEILFFSLWKKVLVLDTQKWAAGKAVQTTFLQAGVIGIENTLYKLFDNLLLKVSSHCHFGSSFHVGDYIYTHRRNLR